MWEGASLASHRLARSAPVGIMQIMFARLYYGDHVRMHVRFHVASLGSLNDRLHCGDHVCVGGCVLVSVCSVSCGFVANLSAGSCTVGSGASATE